MGGLSRFPQSIKQTIIRNPQIIYRLYVQKVSENVDQCQHGKLVINRIFGKEYFDVAPNPPVLKMLIDQTSTDTILTHT